MAGIFELSLLFWMAKPDVPPVQEVTMSGRTITCGGDLQQTHMVVPAWLAYLSGNPHLSIMLQ